MYYPNKVWQRVIYLFSMTICTYLKYHDFYRGYKTPCFSVWFKDVWIKGTYLLGRLWCGLVHYLPKSMILIPIETRSLLELKQLIAFCDVTIQMLLGLLHIVWIGERVALFTLSAVETLGDGNTSKRARKPREIALYFCGQLNKRKKTLNSTGYIL